MSTRRVTVYREGRETSFILPLQSCAGDTWLVQRNSITLKSPAINISSAVKKKKLGHVQNVRREGGPPTLPLDVTSEMSSDQPGVTLDIISVSFVTSLRPRLPIEAPDQ